MIYFFEDKLQCQHIRKGRLSTPLVMETGKPLSRPSDTGIVPERRQGLDFLSECAATVETKVPSWKGIFMSHLGSLVDFESIVLNKYLHSLKSS